MSGLSYAGLHHVKFPVADLDASLQWYETVLKAKREPRFDHLDADGKRAGTSRADLGPNQNT